MTNTSPSILTTIKRVWHIATHQSQREIAVSKLITQNHLRDLNKVNQIKVRTPHN